MEQLNISCSPGTFRRVQNDSQYRTEVTNYVLGEQESSYSEIIFTQTTAGETDIPEQISDERAAALTTFCNKDDGRQGSGTVFDEKQNWHEAATKLMLSLIEELRPKVGKSIHVKTKMKMYTLISERMAEKGYIFTPVQIENKFRGLERTYKKMVLNNRQTGRNRQTCSYESELNQILGQKKGINPEFILESEDVEGVSQSPAPADEFASDTDLSFKDDVPSPNQTLKRKSNIGIREQVAKKMEEMVEEKKSFHAKVLELLQKEDERAQKREERSEKNWSCFRC